MNRPRPTLRQLMIAVLVLAAMMAMIRHAVARWGPGDVAFHAPMVLLTTIALAWFWGPRGKDFGIGFGIGGWAYLWLALGSPLADHLPTTDWLNALHDSAYADLLASPPDDGDFFPGMQVTLHRDRFRLAGQSLLSLPFALLAGLTLMAFSRRRAIESPDDPPDGSLLARDWIDRHPMR